MAALNSRQRDFLLLSVYIMTQNCKYAEALTMVQGMMVMEDDSKEVLLARTILLFLLNRFDLALESLRELDLLDPLEQFGNYTRSDEQSMRHYIRARCLYTLHDADKAKDAIDIYLGNRRQKLSQ
ncbi:hypothetical protein [Pseudovibrio brasiliensis]|uniref:Tetratricopeptide repeat protein n=1 Tax=Pseudovibrio brasiliensis TaxID=1898042 RepID=A0ABX8AH09_9HYPH|nr:hypothetical protein [Pseudovibrio brasiliensis]QUS54374.1 hypothetical protein KGB56_13315 [Pseudovibrio brasiliensis]